MDGSEKFRDRQGREITLSPERWLHIVSAHPEIEAHAQEIGRAVEAPSAVIAGREPDEEWLYLEGAGPSRWLKVVMITSFARRRKP